MIPLIPDSGLIPSSICAEVPLTQNHSSEDSTGIGKTDRPESSVPQFEEVSSFSSPGHVDRLTGRSDVLLEQSAGDAPQTVDQVEWEERERRNQFRHVEGLGELRDVTEVEYRKIRLERVVLIGVWSNARTRVEEAEESLRELAALAQTAGAEVLDGLLQQRAKPDPATYVGSGKARELADIVAGLEADTIIADDDLHPSQRRALEDVTKVKVVDRTALILDIFAQHATSREGKAQVELAQLEYWLPSGGGGGGSLPRPAGGQAGGQSGGMGSSGPG